MVCGTLRIAKSPTNNPKMKTSKRQEMELEEVREEMQRKSDYQTYRASP